jgi:hypothetical protein
MQAIHAVYLERKSLALDRQVGLYVRGDGAPVGRPLELKAVSHHAQQLVALVMGVQSDTYTYARSAYGASGWDPVASGQQQQQGQRWRCCCCHASTA